MHVVSFDIIKDVAGIVFTLIITSYRSFHIFDREYHHTVLSLYF